jgi:hypothetical protein
MASGLVAGTARGPGAAIGQRAIRAAKDRLNRLWYSTCASFDLDTGRLTRNLCGAMQELVSTEGNDFL